MKGVRVGRRESLTHLLFVDCVLLFCFGSERELSVYMDTLSLYKKAMGMIIIMSPNMLFILAISLMVMRQ